MCIGRDEGHDSIRRVKSCEKVYKTIQCPGEKRPVERKKKRRARDENIRRRPDGPMTSLYISGTNRTTDSRNGRSSFPRPTGALSERNFFLTPPRVRPRPGDKFSIHRSRSTSSYIYIQLPSLCATKNSAFFSAFRDVRCR